MINIPPRPSARLNCDGAGQDQQTARSPVMNLYKATRSSTSCTGRIHVFNIRCIQLRGMLLQMGLVSRMDVACQTEDSCASAEELKQARAEQSALQNVVSSLRYTCTASSKPCPTPASLLKVYKPYAMHASWFMLCQLMHLPASCGSSSW